MDEPSASGKSPRHLLSNAFIVKDHLYKSQEAISYFVYKHKKTAKLFKHDKLLLVVLLPDDYLSSITKFFSHLQSIKHKFCVMSYFMSNFTVTVVSSAGYRQHPPGGPLLFGSGPSQHLT